MYSRIAIRYIVRRQCSESLSGAQEGILHIILKEWTTPYSRKTPATTNLEEEEIVGASGNDGNASMPEQVKRPNPWRKMMMNYWG